MVRGRTGWGRVAARGTAQQLRALAAVTENLIPFPVPTRLLTTPVTPVPGDQVVWPDLFYHLMHMMPYIHGYKILKHVK